MVGKSNLFGSQNPSLAQELKAKTKAAIAEGERKRRVKEAEVKAKDLRQKTEWSAIAHRIIADIPDKAGKATEECLFKVKVMKTVNGRDHISYPQKLDYTGLTGVAAMVYNYCNTAGLNPKIQANWDGGGMDSWYEIWIDWS